MTKITQTTLLFLEPHVSSPKKPSKSSARNIGITCLSLTPYLRSEIERHHNYSIRASHGVYIVDVHAQSPAMMQVLYFHISVYFSPSDLNGFYLFAERVLRGEM